MKVTASRRGSSRVNEVLDEELRRLERIAIRELKRRVATEDTRLQFLAEQYDQDGWNIVDTILNGIETFRKMYGDMSLDELVVIVTHRMVDGIIDGKFEKIP